MKKIDGIADIKTDHTAKTASFKVPKGDDSYKEKLAEFAKNNPHLAGYKIQ